MMSAEDRTRMRTLAKDSLEMSPKQIYEAERDFLADMESKYGTKQAVQALTDVWKLAARFKEAEEVPW